MAALTTRLAHGDILGAAVAVFARNGFEETRVEDILDAAGIARRTFYKYFRSKEDVLAAVYELATSELVGAMRSARDASSGGDALDAIRAGLDVYLDYHVHNARLLRVLVERAMRTDSPLAPARRRFRDDLATLLDDAVKKSRGITNEPLLYLALISALEGISLDLLASGTGPEEVERARRVMHLLLDRAVGS
jgi:AcrR family transcriptional regulator